MFYCTTSGIKIVKGRPIGTDMMTKRMDTAKRNGHIVEISEQEYNDAWAKIKESEKKASSGESEEEDDSKREALLERLKALKFNTREFNKVSKLSDEEIEEYLESNEETEEEEEEEEDE
jgi:hypothetical protein